MGHEISIRDGVAEAFYREVPAWHGLGQVAHGARTAKQAMALAHMDWQVEQHALVGVCGDLAGAQDLLGRIAAGEAHGLQAQRAACELTAKLAVYGTDVIGNFRSDGGFLGAVSREYKPIQNWQAFEFIDELVDAGAVEIESCGCLFGGRKVWILARLPGDFQAVTGDPHRRYVLYFAGHDGVSGVRTLLSDIRVVCWNTASLALAQQEEKGWSFAHTGDIRRKVHQARTQLARADAYFARYYDQLKDLASVRVTAGEVREFAYSLLPDLATLDSEAGLFHTGPHAGANTRRAKIRETIVGHFTHSPTLQVPAVAGTALAAYEAASEWSDHERYDLADATANATWSEARQERAMHNAVLGTGAEFKATALATALDLFT